MKAEELIQALNDVNDKYIQEAALYKQKSAGSVKIWRAIAIAACICLAVSAVLTITAVNQQGSRKTADSSWIETNTTAAYYAEEVGELPYYSMSNDIAGYDMAAAAGDYSVSYDYDDYDDYELEEAYEEVYYEDVEYEFAPAPAEAKTADAGTGRQELLSEDAAAEAGAQTQTAPKIIYNVYLEMQTREYDNAVSEIEQAIAACNGYSESQNLSNQTNAYRYADYTIRIPAENLEDFLQQAEEIGTVTYMNKSAQDVSEDYYDVQSRLESAKARLARLQELLAEAENMEDIVELEYALSDTQWEIDNYSGTLRYYDSRVDYSTVNISLREVYEVVTEEAPMTFGDKVSTAFTQGAKSVGNFFKNLIIGLSAAWIWILIIAAVVIAVVLIIRHAVKKHKDKK